MSQAGPKTAECNTRGAALEKQGRLREAIEAYLSSLRIDERQPHTLYCLGNVLLKSGSLPDAIESYRRALALRPQFAEAMNNLGCALRMTGEDVEAGRILRQAVALCPDFADALNNLANLLIDQMQFDQAMVLCRRALVLSPNFGEALGNLGNCHFSMGQVDEAIQCFRRSAQLAPRSSSPHNLLYDIHFHPAYGPKEIWEEHARWNETVARPLMRPLTRHPNDRSKDRRLRVGYVSPDFREHPVGRFMLPLMEHHDRHQFEIFCYTDLRREDAITRRIRPHADAWRPTAAFNDAQLDQIVRADQIDILVDLTLHMKGSRLLALARKPAPVQVTYLAYCSTTGLETIDYRFSDPYLDPEDADVSVYRERTIRLPRTYWCYPAPDVSPEVGPLPADRQGQITFASLNNYAKVSTPIFDTWCQVLSQVPDSRLVLHAHEGSHRQLARNQMCYRGVDPRRLQFVSSMPYQQYLDQYNQIDIALDPFPYGGGTTTCDALWMGVPVVSCRGATAVSRAGLSILSNLGLAELVAGTLEEYVQLIIARATDLAKLRFLRSTLRQRLRASPLMDAAQFARDVEAAYREMWRNWCDQPTV